MGSEGLCPSSSELTLQDHALLQQVREVGSLILPAKDARLRRARDLQRRGLLRAVISKTEVTSIFVLSGEGIGLVGLPTDW